MGVVSTVQHLTGVIAQLMKFSPEQLSQLKQHDVNKRESEVWTVFANVYIYIYVCVCVCVLDPTFPLYCAPHVLHGVSSSILTVKTNLAAHKTTATG